MPDDIDIDELEAIRLNCIEHAAKSVSGSEAEHNWTLVAARLLTLRSRAAKAAERSAERAKEAT